MKNEVNFVWIHSERYQDGAHSPNISLRRGRLRTITEQKTSANSEQLIINCFTQLFQRRKD